VITENAEQGFRIRAVGNADFAGRSGQHLKFSCLVKIAVEQTQVLRRHAVQVPGRIRIAGHQGQDVVGGYLLADAGHAQEGPQGPGNNHRAIGGRDVGYGVGRLFGRWLRVGRSPGVARLRPDSWALAEGAGGKKESGQANNWLHSGRLFEKLRDLRQLRFWVQLYI
jgi:hypothetical protein